MKSSSKPILKGNWDIFAVPASGGAARRLTAQSSQDAIPSWSHDGKWIYFWSDRTGTPQIWKMPNEGGAAVQVTRQGGFAALESPDGNFLYYTKTDDGGDGLWRMPVSGGAETRIIHERHRHPRVLRHRRQHLLHQGGGGRTAPTSSVVRSPIRSRSTVSAPDRHERSPGSPIRGCTLSVAPDGGSLLYSQNQQGDNELRLVEHFE